MTGPAFPGRSGVLVFGSINVDLVCRVAHIPAPGETVLAPAYDVIAGGKGANQALAAARAGARVTLVGAVGADSFAGAALDLLAREGVDLADVRRVAGPTGAAFIAVDARGENAITVASGANRAVQAAWLEAIPAQMGWLLLQGELNWPESMAMAQAAHARGLRVILNAAPSSGFDPAILPCLSKLIVNEHELNDVARALHIQAAHQADVAAAIASQAGCGVIVTKGADGVLLCNAGQMAQFAADSIAPVDTTGAGDTFCGAFVAALAEGRAEGDAIEFAICAASLACLSHGAQPSMPARAAIDARLRQRRAAQG